LLFLNKFLLARPHSSIPLGATVRAFQLSATLITAQSSNGQHIDMNGIVPAIMIGIGHVSRAVRYGALEALHATCIALTKTRDDNGIIALLKALDTSRHEILADHTYARVRCTSLLSHNTNTDTSSLTATQRASALKFLYGHIGSKHSSGYGDCALLSVLRDVTSPNILELVLPILEHYLTISAPAASSSSSDESSNSSDIVNAISLLLARYDEETITSTPTASRALIASLRSRTSYVDEQSQTVSVLGVAVERIKPIFTSLTSADQVITLITYHITNSNRLT
jgi:hypothetical protein